MKTTLSTLLRISLSIIVLAAVSGCGLKGPLVLEQVPVEQTQAPAENSIEQIPLETPTQDERQSAAESE